jgi:protein SCO1
MTPALDPDLTLTDHFGKEVRFTDFQGKYLLVFFGFTHCKVVCPRTLGKLSAALDQLGAQSAELQPLYVSVDPERDSPEVMRAFLEASYPRFLGLTGSGEQIARAKATFRVFAERKENLDDPDDYDVPHTALVYLLDREGNYVLHLAPHLEMDAVVAQLRKSIQNQAVSE